MYDPPKPVPASVFARLPDRFRKPRRTAWADANAGGAELDCFLEGPSFDRAGNLWLVDIPFGRVFRVDPAGDWTLVTEYDGWPNGLKIDRAGRIFVTDYKRGLVSVDAASGKVETLADHAHSEGFKGLNDLFFAADGALYFTDQGQTGLHDPTGRVWRRDPDGALARLLGTVPSPNGIVMNLRENALYVAATRANAVWRVPLMADGTASKVGLFVQMSGGAGGPDGLALDAEGGLAVAHVGTTAWRFDALGRPTHLLDAGEDLFCTNLAYGGPGNRSLFLVVSRRGARIDSGTVLRAELPVPGKPMFSHA